MESSSLKELQLKRVYRTDDDDLYRDFYTKCLSVSLRYDRAVGFFSSKLISKSVAGIANLVRSGGYMRLIIGHPLTDEEFVAVTHGNKIQQILTDYEDKLLEIITSESADANRLKILSWLVASNRLEIKFALRRSGMYHEKIGVFQDKEGDIVVFQGSANETVNGFESNLNAEALSVYPSWDDQTFQNYGNEYLKGFERLWNNEGTNTVTVGVNSSTYEKIAKKAKEILANPDLSLFDLLDESTEGQYDLSNTGPHIPKTLAGSPFKLHAHQTDALNSWKAAEYNGLMKLATGSGKTITSIYAAVKIYEAIKRKNGSLFLLIAVPYKELAYQWIDNLRLFGIAPVKCFESKASWYHRLTNEVAGVLTGATSFAAAVVVNKTLATPTFQDVIKKLEKYHLMFIGDECHNHGAKSINEALPAASFKIGLSATPFRSDEDEVDSPFPNESKQRIINYYGDIVSEYTLRDAINDSVLTPYDYHIIPVYLTIEEQDEYDSLSNQLMSILQKSPISRADKERITQICGKRSRLLGSASNKISELEKVIKSIPRDYRSHTLVYAGEGKSTNSQNEEVKVINELTTVLNESGWRVAKFTGDVGTKERRRLMEAFKEETFDALVAMKVLDEGIDVPICSRAIITASTRNPRQYVQRRGRILRRAPGKHSATIYDFVILPINEGKASRTLKEAELERVRDFTELALNKAEIENKLTNYGLVYDYDR
ncbi:hypothetical protein CWI84_02895 [Idiomarina tyrosinivorans]|uniref:DNA repair helicase n=1 Tax=Idiomarina tyrosinivorans TaxID=1445662 RepID=A0A432ZT66_9GAMM|nr:DEAD/DEAH box helicase family protein [Idiomarina tyrosinivorans]RUO81073.1 hypothetical protein CWI84_02895 [Idiomarina tyrosinivorans]